MSENEQRKDKADVTHTTHIGSVTGQVHTGSGDIVVKSFSVGGIYNKADFVVALQQFKEELEAARQNGLDEETVDDSLSAIEAAEREAQKEAPKATRILERLKQAQAILVASTSVATAATAAVTAVSKLLPLIEKAIQTASQIF